MMDVVALKQRFPIFEYQQSQGRIFHYLDNAATAHKPREVLEAINESYLQNYGPISRGLYQQAEEATENYEHSRDVIATFIGSDSTNVIFTKSATESLNIVAERAIKPVLKNGDEVWITEVEHHSNYLPWQRVCAETGANLKVLRVDENGKLILPPLSELTSGRVKCLAISLISNVLGFYADVPNIIAQVKAHGILTVVDAAQAISIHSVDVKTLDCDFLAFSGHKMFGPTGVGVLYVAQNQKHLLSPHLLGGGMVDWVADNYEEAVWSPDSAAFEAGSPNYSGVMGLAAAAKFVSSLDVDERQQHVSDISITFGNALKEFPRFIVLGDESNWQAGIVTFTHRDVHPHDIAQVCADNGVAVRAGHHCAQPLMNSLGYAATVRASFSVYNEQKDAEALMMSLITAEKIFG